MKYFFLLFCVFLASCSTKQPEKLKALLLTGGCCHNYEKQSQLIKGFTAKSAEIEWTVIQVDKTENKKTTLNLPFYNEMDWATKFDVIVHNECLGKITDKSLIDRVVNSHKSSETGIVFLHCAMHTFRFAGEDANPWHELMGLRSLTHEHQSEYLVKNAQPHHPIMQGFPEVWKTPKDELYIIDKEFPGMTPLAYAHSEKSGDKQTCIWVNEIDKTRVFGITFGHKEVTFQDPTFQKVFTRGLLWSAGRLDR
ncbi:MAG: ThuA domain-containing protein [Lentisphaeraceae bacterium]|nr:ThuA domain-containing protein [Lentisphaeraceae bacterium]